MNSLVAPAATATAAAADATVTAILKRIGPFLLIIMHCARIDDVYLRFAFARARSLTHFIMPIYALYHAIN